MKKIKLASKNKIETDEFSSKYAKERISIWIDEEVLDAYRKAAKKDNTKYQTLINKVLRENIFSEKNSNITKILEKLESATTELRKYKKVLD